MLQCRRFYTDKNFKNRIITNSYSLRNLKWSTRGDELEKNNILEVPRRTNIESNNIKRLNTSSSTEKKLNNNENNKEQNEEKIKNILRLKRESSLRDRKRIISRLKNTSELTDEINRKNKEKDINNNEIKNVNKTYRRINSNYHVRYNNDIKNIYYDEIDTKNISNLNKDNNNIMNNEHKRNNYVESYYAKNNDFEIINNSNVDNGGCKPNLLLYRNVRHIYKKNIIKSLVLKEKNSKIINDDEKYETKNILQINDNSNNKQIIISSQAKEKNKELKIKLKEIKLINGYKNDNNNYNSRNNTETNLDLVLNSYRKRVKRINSEIIETKMKTLKPKEIEPNNNDNINENNNIKLKRIKTIKNNTKNDNNKGNNRYSYYSYLITKVKRNSFIESEINHKYSNSSIKLDSYTHKTFINSKYNNQSHMVNLKVLPSNNKYKSIESEKVETQNKKTYDKKTFAINVFENIINICDALDNRNEFMNLIHKFNTKYFLMKGDTYNDEYNLIFIDNQNFEYVLKHFGLVLIALIFFTKDDNLYNSYKSKVKELLIQIIYSSLNYVDMDNCYIESEIIKNFIKLNNSQSIISSIHRLVLCLINLLFNDKKEYSPLKEALEQIYSILLKKNFLSILKIINESILFCYNSKSKTNYAFPFFKFNNNMISLKIQKDANNSSIKNNHKTKTNNTNIDDKVTIESVPFIKTPMKKKFCLVLDIDETISHTLKLNFGGYFLLRPGAKSFLEEVGKYYEIIIFTSSPKKYADKILDKIDVNGNIISHRLYKNHVLYENGKTIKNLNLIGRDLTKTIFVDNLRSNAKYNLDNLCPITTWKSDIFDNRLIKLKEKLTYIATCGKFDDDITQGL